MASWYGELDTAWYSGNFDNDGVTGFTDLVALAQHYGQTAANLDGLPPDFVADWALAQSLVPELTAALALGVLLVGRRARQPAA